jgi:hypothetical protein
MLGVASLFIRSRKYIYLKKYLINIILKILKIYLQIKIIIYHSK